MIRFTDLGAGPPLVLVHGWASNRTFWREQLTLADRFRVITVDLAGHGESPDLRSDWSMAGFGDDVVSVLDELDLADAILIGHSMGGNACLEAARSGRRRVAGIVWLDTYGRLDVPDGTPSVDEFVAPFEADFAGTTRSFVEQMFLPSEDPTIAAWVIESMASAPPDIAVPSLHASLTYGRGAHHLVPECDVPIVAINTAYLGLDEASLSGHGVDARLLDGVGHFAMLTRPARVNGALTDAVESWI